MPAYQEAVPAAPQAAPAPDPIEQLEQLGELHQRVLTDEEFAAQKAKLLAG